MIHRSSFLFPAPVYIAGGAAVVGPKEGEGPLKEYFDKIYPSIQSAEESWEKTEIAMQRDAVNLLLKKTRSEDRRVDLLLGGDLINQLTITNFAAGERDIPFLGLYNACATMAEGILLGASLINAGYIGSSVVVVSSHNATSERQFRYPTELGIQRPSWSQWTVTAAGALLLSSALSKIRVRGCTVGRVVDYGVKDANDMGAAMAPAAADTILRHLSFRGQSSDDYDLILSGDLGSRGLDLLKTLLRKEEILADERFQDSGRWMYFPKQDVFSGGSGAGCSASVWSSYLLNCFREKKYRRVLLIGTGALLSTISVGQGNTIPSIAHAVELERV